MKRFLLFILITINSSFSLKAQDFLGYINSNYAGVTGTDLQPASVVNSRYRLDVSLIGTSFSFYNNHIGLKKDAFKHTGGLFSGDYPAFQDTAFGQHYLTRSFTPEPKSLYLANQIYLPSFLVSIDDRNAFALKWKVRTLVNVDGVSNELATLVSSKFDYPSLFSLKLHNEKLSIQTMSWAEYGLTYGHVFQDKGAHFLKAGASVKAIQGLQAAYMYVDDLNYEFTTDSTLSLFNTHINYGHSTNYDTDGGGIKYKYVSNPSFGFDLGVVYEWRPAFEEFKYDMDGETNLNRKDKNKYKLRVGLSLLDVGKVKFDRGEHSQDFTADVNFWDLSKLGITSLQELDDTLKKRFLTSAGTGTFKMHLPTTFSAQIDYNIYKDFYINFTPYYLFKFKDEITKVHDVTTFSLTPRWDHKWFGAFVPFSYDAMKHKKMGLGLRLGPLVIGTNNINPFISKKDIYGVDVYCMLKIPIMYRRPKDRDHDKVSDRKDKCKDVAGVWEFKGCPDRDGDHIQDNDDACPNEPGLPEFKGCPDRDSDGIPDKDDRCPDIVGPASNNGCPETKLSLIDLQGTILQTVVMSKDSSFAISDLPSDELVVFRLEGVDIDAINEIKVVVNGIPKKAIRNDADRFFRFIILKTDKNKLDQENAFDIAIRLNQQQKAVMKKAFENLEFATGNDRITELSFESLDALAGLMLSKTSWKLKISGYTDNTGGAIVNQKLSQQRAEAVKKYLVLKGISAKRIKTEWFGSQKSIGDNKTEQGRQKNRRVEMLLVK